jgi:hypothetical protein
MWTANIIQKYKQLSQILVTIEYTDGTNTFTEQRSSNGGFSSLEELKKAVAKRIDNLNAQDALDATLEIGEVGTPEEPIVIVDTDKQIFLDNCQKLAQMKQAISLGLIKEDDAEYVALLEKTKTSYSSDYLSII